MSKKTDTPKQRTGAGLLTFLLIICGAALFAASALYARNGQTFLTRIAPSVGEMLMQYGENAEAAGKTLEAMRYYATALEGRFEGVHNRAHTEHRLGELFLETGNAEKAREILSTGPAIAHSTPDSYATLLKVLVALGDAEALAERIDAAPFERLEPEQALWFRGQRALLEGDEDAAAEAFAEAVELDPASPAAVELARLDADRREQLLRAFLLHGGTGEAADAARAMLGEAGR